MNSLNKRKGLMDGGIFSRLNYAAGRWWVAIRVLARERDECHSCGCGSGYFNELEMIQSEIRSCIDGASVVI